MNRAISTVESQRSAHGAVLSLIIAVTIVGTLVRVCYAESSKALEVRISAVLTDTDNGRTIDLRVGDDALLRLPENATTGYRWAVDAANESLVEIKEGRYFPASDAVGSGGEIEWILHAKA